MEFGWKDPRLTGIASIFTTEESVAKFLGRYTVLKADVRSSFFSVETCLPTKNVCMGRPNADPPFFYMYSCLFSDLHVHLPFNNLTISVLRTLTWHLPSFTRILGRPFKPFA